ncbi:hypothetical protein Syun_003841 [Stephania yunnanensis]|uniref:Uncharacterized protein n=1 Tax=Stephania yunnanensis TaxID=152371 RepID=A0AAP0Q201_9MAGN
MARGPPDSILTDGVLDGQPPIGGGGGRAASRDRESLRRDGRDPSFLVHGRPIEVSTLFHCCHRQGRLRRHIFPLSHRRACHHPIIPHHGILIILLVCPNMTFHRLLYLLHFQLHHLHHPAGPTRPWEPPLECLEGVMELPRRLLSNPFLPAPSATPQEEGGGTPHIVRFPIIIESVGQNRWVLHLSKVCAWRMTKILKRGMITKGYCWKLVSDHQKDIHWERWKPYFRWDPSIDEAVVRVVRAAYDAKGALYEDEDDEVTPNDVFLHVHTKDHDGVTFIDSISARFHAKLVRRREQRTQDTLDQLIDEEQLYYDAVEECPKGRVYGLRSLAKRKRRYDPSASTSRESMVRSSELDAIVQRLAQFEAYVQS